MKSPKKYAELLPGDILVYTRPGLTGPSFISAMYLIVGRVDKINTITLNPGALLYVLTISEKGFPVGRIQDVWWSDAQLISSERCIVIKGQ